MPERTSITTDAAGRRVMAKTAGSAQEAVKLEREAELLEAARHAEVIDPYRTGVPRTVNGCVSTP